MKQDVIFSNMEKSTIISMQKFNSACDEAIKASYIISNAKISKLLIAIASCKPIYILFENIVSDYNFIADFENCKYRDEKGALYLQVPVDPKNQICFAFCLLYALDTAKLDLKNLLSSFYKHSDGANYEYELFCNDILIPFKKNVNDIINENKINEVIFAETATTTDDIPKE